MIGFVILHYMAENETINCINSIKRCIEENHIIIVIDNASTNGSGKSLKTKYEDDSSVIVKINETNIGFARGNNVGYSLARTKYHCEYIIILNNDVELIDSTLVRKIRNEFEINKYGILGPDIYSTTYEIHQSPKRINHYTIEEIRHFNAKCAKDKEGSLFLKIKCIFKSSFYIRKKYYQLKRKKMDFRNLRFNVPLHGAFLVFSPLYVKNHSTAFFEGTFFYFETEILDYFCMNEAIITEYCPYIKVLHHQNVSTDIAHKDLYEKTLFSYRCNYESTKAFLDIYG